MNTYISIFLSFIISTVGCNLTMTMNAAAQNMEYTVDTPLWLESLEKGDIDKIDSLIKMNVDFQLPLSPGTVADILGFDHTTGSNPYQKVLCYALKRNMDLTNQYTTDSFRLKDVQVKEGYYSFQTDSFVWEDFNILSEIGKKGKGLDNITEEERLCFVEEARNTRDSLEKRLKEQEKAIDKNLQVVKYTLEKGEKLNTTSLNRFLYAGSDWLLSKKSTLFFYYYLYNVPSYFAPDVNLVAYKPADILLSYVSFRNTDKSLLEFLAGRIPLAVYPMLCKTMYPKGTWEQLGEDLFDTTIPSWSSEKVLMKLIPGMDKESGHTLLHAAIVNLDIKEVNLQIWNNKRNIDTKTVPGHIYFSDVYGEEPYTALELARFTEARFLQGYEERKKQAQSSLRELSCLQQIRKIIQILETGDRLVNKR